MILDDQAGLKEAILPVLRTVFDPEIPVNILELGLVYNLDTTPEGGVRMTMTLTAPGCPVAGDIISELDEKIRQIPGVKDVHIMLTFEPPWNKDMMSQEAKLELGFL